jgi:hypothetical protein
MIFLIFLALFFVPTPRSVLEAPYYLGSPYFKCACLLTTCFPVPTVFVWFPHIKTGCFLHIVSFPPVHWQQEVDV